MNEIGLFAQMQSNLPTALLGFRQDVSADFHLLLQCIHPDDRRAFGRNAMQSFRDDCPRHSAIEFRVVREEGRVQWLHMERRAMMREDGPKDVVRILGFALEISPPEDLRRAA